MRKKLHFIAGIRVGFATEASSWNTLSQTRFCQLHPTREEEKWPETDLNRRHVNFQSTALPTELSGHDFHRLFRRTGSKSGPAGFDNRKINRFLKFPPARGLLAVSAHGSGSG